MEHPDFIQLQQDYLENKNKLVFLELEFLRQKKLQEKNVSSEKVYQQATADYKGMKARVNALKEKLALIGINVEQLEKSEKISRTITIHSPINGYVTRMNINVGKYVHPADIMFEIVNAEHMHVELTVFEKDIHKIKTGQKIRFTLPNESDTERTASVHLIGRSIEDNRTVKVHGHLDEENTQFLSGMLVKAFIEIESNTVNAL